MLRPATPLTVLLFAAFGLLLISVISTPIIKQVPLASFEGVDFGVFGFCQGTTCSDLKIGYSTASLFTDTEAASFDLPTSTRTTLSAILIIHPIAALFTLVMLILAASAHFHSPSHSPRFLLGIFILSILTLVLALLSFLIDVLLFVPHMAWGSYIVLAATILIAASGIVSCAMRRTLVSRKARKRRIAENAEMNGENFYNRERGGLDPTLPKNPIDATPIITVGAEKPPTFATFETKKKDSENDERIPLTARTPSDRSPNNVPFQPMGMQRKGSPPRDQYGNPMPVPPPGAYGMRGRDPPADPSMRRQYSDNSMNRGGRGGMPPGYRGRGGFPPNRGGYGPPRGGYGPGPNRGGYGPPRGGYGPGPNRGGYGPPSRGGGYGGYGVNEGLGTMGMGPAAGMAPGGTARGGRGPPPNYAAPQNGRGYNRDPSPGPPYGQYRPSPNPAPSSSARDRSPAPGGYIAYTGGDDARSSLPRAESPPPLPNINTSSRPVGQAVEMDASTGSPSLDPRGFGQFGNIRESDGDVAGMVGLQQQKSQLPRETLLSETSRYSTDEPYVPPRQAWGDNGPPGRGGSPLNPMSQSTGLPSTHKRTSSGNYFEDIDPRFVDSMSMDPDHPSLIPGALQPANNFRLGLDTSSNPYDDIQDGARSPAESDRSNFTSVSQRGINPRWNGPNGGGYGGGGPMPPRRPVPPRQNDILLNSNPDFELPGGRGGRGGRGGGTRGGGRGIQGPYPGGAL